MLMQIGDKITVKRAAQILGCSDAHVRRLVGSGIIDGEFFSGVWAVSRPSVEKYAKIQHKTGRPRGPRAS